MPYTDADLALIFSRLVIDALLSHTCSPATIERWAISSAHYGRLALNDREQQHHAIRSFAADLLRDHIEFTEVLR